MTCREPATVPGEPPDERPVGPLDDCPACGEPSGNARDPITGIKQYRGPYAAQVCKDAKCHEVGLHLHQSCESCKHRWTVLPVGVKRAERDRPEMAATPKLGLLARAAIRSAEVGAIVLVAKLLGWL